MKKALRILLAVCMMALLSGCGMEKQSMELNYGEEKKIVLQKEADGIEWASSDEAVAAVYNGTVKAAGPGEAVVTAQKNGKAVAEITVSVNLVDITAILFSQKNIELKPGNSFQQKYTLIPDNASDYGLSWKSANPEVAEVDDNGTIWALSPGTTTVVCSTPDGIMETCEVVVKDLTTIDYLNENEKILFDGIVTYFLPNFINPSSVRIQKIEFVRPQGATENHDEELNLWLTIQSTNTSGRTNVAEYWAIYDKEKCTWWASQNGVDMTYDLFKEESTQLSVSMINAALGEYWINHK